MDHTDVVRDLTFAPDGSLMLVSASTDKTLRVWDLKDDGRWTSLEWPVLWHGPADRPVCSPQVTW